MKLALPVLAAILCLFAMMPGWDYGFFMLLRCVVFVAALFCAVEMKRQQRHGFALACGGIALLFNPLIVVHLDRQTWRWLDGGTAVFLALCADKIRNAKDRAGMGS